MADFRVRSREDLLEREFSTILIHDANYAFVLYEALTIFMLLFVPR